MTIASDSQKILSAWAWEMDAFLEVEKGRTESARRFQDISEEWKVKYKKFRPNSYITGPIAREQYMEELAKIAKAYTRKQI